jgi:hypothetical protein
MIISVVLADTGATPPTQFAARFHKAVSEPSQVKVAAVAWLLNSARAAVRVRRLFLRWLIFIWVFEEGLVFCWVWWLFSELGGWAVAELEVES